MATKTKKAPAARPRRSSPSPQRKPQQGRPTSASSVDDLDDIDEPDRSAPALAEVDAEALEFIAAIERFKKEHGRPFPSWSEILLIVRQLGYHRP